MSLSLRFAAGSHKGMIRQGNEDSGYAGPRLLAIADGMGGAAAGEVASSEVISSLVDLDDEIPGSDILTSLGVAVQRANERLRLMVEEDPQLDGMGTTLTALLWTGQRLGLVHVGDSRAYLLRDGVLTQITQDHTWVARLVDEGRITEEEATTHPQRSLLMRNLGSADQVEPDLSIREVRPGDRYLLCSDGLSGVVSHQTMEETLASYQGPQETVQDLIQLALRGGGPDNVTVIVADVLDVDHTDTMSVALNDTPVVVGAVAENQHPSHDDGAMQTPAGRASGLGRQAQAPAPGGSGAAPSYAPEDWDDDGDEYGKPRGGRRWLKRSLWTVVALAVIGGGLYGGYRWTQSQYYVGVEDDHVALYQGISQDLAWVDLSKVARSHPEIELKYLPPYQKKQVEGTITESSRAEAQKKIDELNLQAGACKKDAERRQAAARAQAEKEARDKRAKEQREKERQDSAGTPQSTPQGTTPGGTSTADTVAWHATTTAASPSPGPSLSEEEQKLVPQCGKQ
ncbi:protein phosphatase 2C domain-containing protein [Streptomyces sp. SID11385]|uniref:PP2C family protein-serine/threonine phosphatase n=1 Tax=Streptomyces sp. SID11385 TaxID=2706031 RepID=UPI0013CA81D1|nr:protein phosphatase 2C domain-containing protein [Streptomyces sp. SID11385]NEA39708.1 serine/threonine-protein phosphatase [Streptomyces sp. SID11385]